MLILVTLKLNAIAFVYAFFAIVMIAQDEKLQEMKDEDVYFQSSKHGDSMLSEHMVMNLFMRFGRSYLRT